MITPTCKKKKIQSSHTKVQMGQQSYNAQYQTPENSFRDNPNEVGPQSNYLTTAKLSAKIRRETPPKETTTTTPMLSAHRLEKKRNPTKLNSNTMHSQL